MLLELYTSSQPPILQDMKSKVDLEEKERNGLNVNN